MIRKTSPKIIEEDNYFVTIHNPIEIRRQLLESSKKILHCLQSYQRIQLIRIKKLEEKKKLEEALREIEFLNKKLKDKSPKYKELKLDLPVRDVKKIRLKTPKFPEEKKLVVKEINASTDLDKLQVALANIEKKLAGL